MNKSPELGWHHNGNTCKEHFGKANATPDIYAALLSELANFSRAGHMNKLKATGLISDA
jgi:hypothetical protein